MDYIDIFTWIHSDMPSVDPCVLPYLTIDSTFKLVIQKCLSFNQNWYQATQDEFNKLLADNFIREVHYSKWITNVIFVKKTNDKWQMCADFIDLN